MYIYLIFTNKSESLPQQTISFHYKLHLNFISSFLTCLRFAPTCWIVVSMICKKNVNVFLPPFETWMCYFRNHNKKWRKTQKNRYLNMLMRFSCFINYSIHFQFVQVFYWLWILLFFLKSSLLLNMDYFACISSFV